ncbi:NADPH-dependent FMN reductase [Flavobacterium sp. N1994]|uniref:NADPH-dependent FMN reductase n=1 Tax=Flavobacterium sp. N1994 TaxID=2986827 RepID=UPI0022228578|nr:NAD(P)H-dependent oxidoreductase [Flavobacterium sp. N1994]
MLTNSFIRGVETPSPENTILPHIAIISSSVRNNRKSHFVSLYFQNYLTNSCLATNEILDLKKYAFPVFEDKLSTMVNPSEQVIEFADKIKSANGIIIVTPEYNGGYPASLKNVIDLLLEEWHHKPVGIVTVSDGAFGGSQVLVSLQFTLWKMKAITIPAIFSVPNVDKQYTENGVAIEKETTDKLAAVFISELLSVVKSYSKNG